MCGYNLTKKSIFAKLTEEIFSQEKIITVKFIFSGVGGDEEPTTVHKGIHKGEENHLWCPEMPRPGWVMGLLISAYRAQLERLPPTPTICARRHETLRSKIANPSYHHYASVLSTTVWPL